MATPARGTGVLNNELYIGRLVWNRLRYVKDPDSGKRVSRPNPPSQWVTTSVSDLRIVDDELWSEVKARQAAMRRITSKGDPSRFNRGRSSCYVLATELLEQITPHQLVAERDEGTFLNLAAADRVAIGAGASRPSSEAGQAIVPVDDVPAAALAAFCQPR